MTKKLFTIVLSLLFSVGGLFATSSSYTITFKNTSTTSDASSTSSTIATVISSGSEYVSSISCTNVYQGKNGYGIKLGTGSKTGSITLNLATDGQKTPTSVVVNAAKYGSDTGTLTVKLNTSSNTGLSPANSPLTLSTLPTSALTSIVISTSAKRAYIISITVTYDEDGGGSVDPDPVVTKTLQSIAVTTQPTKTTYTEGETFSNTGCVITGTYSDGSTKILTDSVSYTPTTALTTSNTTITYSYLGLSCTQTITVNAAVVPEPTGDCTSSIDFESAASTYTDWTFSTITSQGTYTGITAHGGSYFGRISSSSGYIVSKEEISNLQSIKFYISKQTTNTTSSTWKVFVSNGSESTNPSSWTLAGSKSATGMSVGEWQEVSIDLSAYYSSANKIAIYYTGTSAVRYIDDICLSFVTDPTIATKGVDEITTMDCKSASKTGSVTIKYYTQEETLTATSSNSNFTVSCSGLNYTVTYKPSSTSCTETTTITLSYGSTLSTTITVTGSNTYSAPTVTATTTDVEATLTWTSVLNATSYKVVFDGTEYTTTGTTYTIHGLSNETSYTYTITPIIGSLTCVTPASGSVKTKTCMNHPTSESISFESNTSDIKIYWTLDDACNVYLYNDSKCTSSVGHCDNVTNTCTFTGLDENKTYYAVIYGDGTCPSDTIEIPTQSPYITIVNWFPDSIHVDLNSADAATVQLEKETTSTTRIKNVADELFFSKYFEAKANLKLIAIYNGTDHDIDLTGYKIISAKGGYAWNYSGTGSSVSILELGDLGTIPTNTEFILYEFTNTSMTTDGAAVNCVTDGLGWNHENWYPMNYYAAHENGVDTAFAKSTVLSFAGDKAIMLLKVNQETNDTTFLDLIGSGSRATAGTASDEININIAGSLTVNINGRDTTASWSDGGGWVCYDGTDYSTKETIPLSTNRFLLIRKNTVKSGFHAVATNTTYFNTLCEEWEGKPVGYFAVNDASKGYPDAQTTCEHFQYVAEFNYQGYYSSFDSVSSTNLNTNNRNADGTYTISIPELDTLSCRNIKVISKDASGNTLAEEQQRVPIMVTTNMNVNNQLFLQYTVDTCKICDVVIENNSTLSTVASPQRPKFKNVYVYAGSTLSVPSSTTHSINALTLRSEGDVVPYTVLNNTLTSSVKKVYFTKRITNDRYYFFSLPYDCKVSDVYFTTGENLIYGNDWQILYYDGASRASDNNSKSSHWKSMDKTSTLKAGIGYAIAVNVAQDGWKKEIVFPMAITSSDIYATDIVEKSVTVYAYGSVNGSYPEFSKDGLHANSVGWNFIGNPYLNTFGALTSETAKTGKVILQASEGWYDGFDDNSHVYYTIPNAGQDQTYYQDFSSLHNLNPFQATFIQAACDGTITFSQSAVQRTRVRNVNHDYDIIVRINLNNGVSEDFTTFILGDYNDEYEVGYDLLKSNTWYTEKPQLYSILDNDKLAFASINDSTAKEGIQLGTYIYKAHKNTFSVNYEVSNLSNVEHIYLYDKVEGTITDLLMNDYIFTTNSQIYDNSRFSVSIILKEEREMPTNTNDILIDGNTVYLEEYSKVYDVLGRELINNKIGFVYLPKGIYIISNKEGSKKIIVD